MLSTSSPGSSLILSVSSVVANVDAFLLKESNFFDFSQQLPFHLDKL